MKKTNSHTSQSKFSWLAYGTLSLSMLVIAAVSATVGQDGQEVFVVKSETESAATEDSSELLDIKMGTEAAEIKRDRQEIESYLNRKFILSLHPEMFSRRAMPAREYKYAVKAHIDDQNIGNLIRFQITRTSHDNLPHRSTVTNNDASEPVETVVATGVLQVDSAKIYMATPMSNGVVTLKRLNRKHLAAIRNFSVESSADTAGSQIAQSSKR